MSINRDKVDALKAKAATLAKQYGDQEPKPKRVRKPKVEKIWVEEADVFAEAQPELPIEMPPAPEGKEAIDLLSFKPNRQQTRTAASRKTRPNGKPRPTPLSQVTDDGYRVLHPTKGWRNFTVARVRRINAVDTLRQGWAFITRKMSDAQLPLFRG
jgi:hypothetical protein